MQLKIVQGFADRGLLLGAQLIVGGSKTVENPVVLTELMEPVLRFRGIDLEPFGAGLVLDAEFAQICMEIGIVEHFAVVFVGGVPMPFEFRDNVRRMGLLRDTGFHVLLGVADFRPTVMTTDFRSGVRVNLGECRT